MSLQVMFMYNVMQTSQTMIFNQFFLKMIKNLNSTVMSLLVSKLNALQ